MDKIVIKCCGDNGFNNRGTDSSYSNFYIAHCGFTKETYAFFLGTQNSNLTNFKIYMNKFGGIYCESGCHNNNLLNFNVQENEVFGLKMIAGRDNVVNNNFLNFVFDSNTIAIDMYQVANNYISGMVTSTLATVTTEKWIQAWECLDTNYIDVLASAGVAHTDKKGIVFSKTSP